MKSAEEHPVSYSVSYSEIRWTAIPRFAVIATPWGYLVAPPEQEVWYLNDNPPYFEVHNLTGTPVRVGFPDTVARQISTKSFDIAPGASQVFVITASRSQIGDFSFGIQTGPDGARACAGSDPRILIRP